MNNRGRLEELLSAMIGQRALLERLVRLSPHDPAWAEQRLAVTARIATLEAALAAPVVRSPYPTRGWRASAVMQTRLFQRC